MTSVLDQMTAGITERKQARTATLTPVGTEKGGPESRIPVDTPRVMFAPELLLETADGLQKHAESLLSVARDLRLMAGNPAEVEANLAAKVAVEEKLMEREADRRVADREAAEAGDKRAQARVDNEPTDEQTGEAFAARMKRMQAEAQAATFASNDAPAAEPIPVASGSPVEGWVCPTHGDANLTEMTSRKGRKYRACTTCAQFEK